MISSPDPLSESLLSALVGEAVSAVVFVRDYVQVEFDGPRLSLYVWPQVVTGSTARSIGDPGYRDALCALIGHTVLAVAEDAGNGLVVAFGSGAVQVKPEPYELEGPEIAMLAGFVGRTDWMVWRPGEPPFDGPEWS